MAKKTKPESGASKGLRGVNLEEAERVVQFMEKHRLEQFEYERDGVRLLLRKAPARGARALSPEPVFESREHGAVEEPSARPAAKAEPSPSESAAKAADEGLHVVKSPIVGTFYAAASPGSEPFVTVGTRVEDGQVLCIIEAMKLMNEIEADVAGEVVNIFVENGHPVEYGERLFGIRPAGKK
jgi:acetyl-CoA carboxylase biotin carboxyl carrier protein